MTVRTARPELRRPDGAPVRVLVVDDEPTLAELVTIALRYEGWEVRSAGDGGAAVRAAREFRPDVVVLDVMLPDFDGTEVLRRMRADTAEMPVLFLTAKDAVEDRIAGLAAGARCTRPGWARTPRGWPTWTSTCPPTSPRWDRWWRR